MGTSRSEVPRRTAIATRVTQGAEARPFRDHLPATVLETVAHRWKQQRPTAVSETVVLGVAEPLKVEGTWQCEAAERRIGAGL
jgi:hypothetical protein